MTTMEQSVFISYLIHIVLLSLLIICASQSKIGVITMVVKNQMTKMTVTVVYYVSAKRGW